MLMAVQAQYSSNRYPVVDEGNDYPSLQSQSNLPAWNKKRQREDDNNVMNRQSNEIDQFLQAQLQQMRRTLADKRQRQYCELMGVAEEWARRTLWEKEVEVEKAGKRNAELEARAGQLRTEVQVWQARAMEQEAMAASLQIKLQHAIVSGGDDAESGCVEADREGECRACKRQVATMVILPCRHLSICRDCDAIVQACPLCLSFRTSSMEVFLF